MSTGAPQPPVSVFGLLAGAAVAAAASAAAAGASAALSRLPKPRLSAQAWWALQDETGEGKIGDQGRFLSLAQQGVDPGLRRSVWPFLLHLFPADSTDAERQVLCSELETQFSSLLAAAEAASVPRNGDSGDAVPSNDHADSHPDGSASDCSGSSGGGEGADTSGSDSGSATLAETQRCIMMDVLRSDFDALASGGLTGESAATAMPPDVAAASIECISAAAQATLDEAQHLTAGARRQAARLFNLLSVHAVHDPSLGYAQGMSDLAAIFLLVFPDSEALPFWCFERMMVGAREGFRHDECGIRRQLRQLSVLLSRADPVLHQHLKALQCADCLFAYRMVVVLLLRDLKSAQAVRLWEGSWADQCLMARQAAATTGGSEPSARDITAATAAAPQQPPAPHTAPAVGLLQAFVLAVICGERRHVLQQCAASDDVICHFATIRIRFEPMLREARRLQQQL